MNAYLNKFVRKAKMTVLQATDLVKERIFAITGTSSTTVQQLAGFIQHHPETTMTTKKLLGLSYSFYHLDYADVHYYLETKKSYILQLDVQTKDHPVVSYRSYRDHHTLNTPIKFP
jgi:hypothetical protein